jgi:hypothetical protein
MPSRIVTSIYRYKRPLRRNAVPLEGPAIVGKRLTRSQQASAPKPPAPANDYRKLAIVTATKRGRRPKPEVDPAAGARVKEFLARMVRPSGG